SAIAASPPAVLDDDRGRFCQLSVRVLAFRLWRPALCRERGRRRPRGAESDVLSLCRCEPSRAVTLTVRAEKRLHGGGAEFAAYRPEGVVSAGTAPLLIWGHGWGHSHAALMPLARAMQAMAASLVIDFPGFGAAPLPPDAWGTADYADAVAEWLPQ